MQLKIRKIAKLCKRLPIPMTPMGGILGWLWLYRSDCIDPHAPLNRIDELCSDQKTGKILTIVAKLILEHWGNGKLRAACWTRWWLQKQHYLLQHAQHTDSPRFPYRGLMIDVAEYLHNSFFTRRYRRTLVLQTKCAVHTLIDDQSFLSK